MFSQLLAFFSRLFNPGPEQRFILDRIAIQDLLTRYARGADRRDFDLMASCFASDALFSYPGTFEARGTADIIEKVSRLKRWQTTMHFMGAQEVQIDGDTETAETYAVAFHRGLRLDGEEQEYVVGLRYVDHLVRSNGGWLIQEHHVHADWRRGESLPVTGEE